MKKRSLFFIVLFLAMLFLTSCASDDRQAGNHPLKEHEIYVKETFKKNRVGTIQPIMVNPYSFVEINDWYDEQTVLIHKDENGVSILEKFNLTTGDQEAFFQVNEPILSVIANVNRSYFAIQTTSFDHHTPLYIVNKDGEMISKMVDLGEDYSIYWNPYSPEQMLLVSYLPNWQFEVYEFNVKKQTLQLIELDQTYFQWLNHEEIAYLLWDDSSPNLFAPLYKYHLHTKETTKMVDEVITFFSFPGNILVTMTLDDVQSETRFTIYKNNQRLTQTTLPILNTYSDQWWVPFHQLDHQNDIFYFFKPTVEGDYFQYNGRFELIGLNLNNGIETVIKEFDHHFPILLSPNGLWMLYGEQKELLIDIQRGTVQSLVQ